MSTSSLLLLAEALSGIALILGAHALRRKYSLGLFYSALSFMLVLIWTLPQDLAVQVGSLRFLVPSSILFSSLLLGAFVSYTFDGPRAGRVSIGIILGGTALFAAVAAILRHHGTIIDPASPPLFPAFEFRTFAASVIATFSDLIFLAVCWEFLNRFRSRIPLLGRVFLALLLVLWLDVLVFITIAFVENPAYLAIIKGNFVTRLVIAVFMAPLLASYMAWETRQFGAKFESRPLLAIFLEENLAKELQAAEHRVELGQQALQESEAKYRATVEDLPLMICGFQPDGQLTYTNLAYDRYFGRSAEDETKRSFGETLAAKSRDRLQAYLNKLSSTRPTGTLELDVSHQPGDTGSNRWNFRALFDQEGQLLAYLAIGEDVTREKRLEKQLNQSQKLEAVGRLAGGIAHDFNNVLTAILGNCELALVSLKNNPNNIEVAREGLQEIEMATDRAAALVKQLLIFGRKDVGEFAQQDVSAVVMDLQKMLSRIVAENITMAWEPTENLAPVRADRGQLEQVVMNLVINAADAMPVGGTVQIKTANVSVAPHDNQYGEDTSPGEYVCLEVIDDGIGISEEDIGQIFEPFFTTKGPDKGTGLGLSTTFAIVKQSGGFIQVHSQPGLGSHFQILWPVASSTDSVPEPTPATRDLAPMTPVFAGTVLVCEDEDAIRQLTVKQLQRSGYQVVAAANGMEALQVAADPEVDVVMLVTDVIMPEMNGWDLAQELTRRQPHVKTLFVSGYSGEVLAKQGIMAADINILTKPFRRAALLNRIKKLWED